jgi:hypothetical protein
VDNTMPAPERWDPMTQVESVLPASDGASVSPAQPTSMILGHSNGLTLPPDSLGAARGGGTAIINGFIMEANGQRVRVCLPPTTNVVVCGSPMQA